MKVKKLLSETAIGDRELQSVMSVARIFGGEGGSVQDCSAVKIYLRRGKTLIQAVRSEGEKVRYKM